MAITINTVATCVTVTNFSLFVWLGFFGGGIYMHLSFFFAFELVVTERGISMSLGSFAETRFGRERAQRLAVFYSTQ